jgi:hypothetical protein
MGFTGRIGFLLLNPREAFKPENLNPRGLGEPFGLLVVFSAVIGILVSSLLLAVVRLFAGMAEWFGFEAGSFLASVSMLLSVGVTVCFIILAIILWALISVFTHLSARYLFKGSGRYSGALKAYGYSVLLFPTVLGLLLLVYLPSLAPLSIILVVISTVWLLFSWVTAVESYYSINGGKAFVSAFIIPLAFFSLIALAVILPLATVFRGFAA